MNEKLKEILSVILIFVVLTIFILILCENAERYDKEHPVEKCSYCESMEV